MSAGLVIRKLTPPTQLHIPTLRVDCWLMGTCLHVSNVCGQPGLPRSRTRRCDRSDYHGWLKMRLQRQDARAKKVSHEFCVLLPW